MPQSDRFSPVGGNSRNAALAGVVVAVHAAALWAMQHGFTRQQPPEVVVPAEVIAEFVTPPAPESKPTAPPPPPSAPAPKPQPRPVMKKAPPLPRAVADPAPAPAAAPRGSSDDAPAEKTPPAPPSPPAPPAPPSPPRMEQPSSNADYLNNPAPAYPSVSKRMGEQGKVLLRVYINEQGQPEKIEIKQSSGYDRLDQVALDTVRHWKFVPGKRNGMPEAMWHNVPINFVLR